MRQAEAKLDPALRPLRDNVLYLKHNLNAQAVAALGGETAEIQGNVKELVSELSRSIEESNRFIETLTD
jgi:hypothetical protein